MVQAGKGVQDVSAIEESWGYILIPSDFTWADDQTFLVHQGAVILRPEPGNDRGRVIGYTTLCTEVMEVRWRQKPGVPDTSPLGVVTCFECLGATEQ